ncbi:MAG: WD40 repeat domain-containing protein [Byssovorax sp.]
MSRPGSSLRSPRAALLVLIGPACVAACSGGAPAPVEAPVVVASVAPTATASAAATATPCDKAESDRARVKKLLAEGKLDRARRVIERADKLCAASAAESAADKAAILAELGRADQGGEALYQAGLSAKEAGRAVEAQKLFDRAIAAIEREVHASRGMAGVRFELDTPNGITGSVEDMAFAHLGDRTYLAVAHGRNVSIFDLATMRLRDRVVGKERIASVAASPDGMTLAGGSLDAIRFWDITSGKETFRRDGAFNAVTYSNREAGLMLVADKYEPLLQVWDAETHDVKVSITPKALPPKGKAAKGAPPAELPPVHIESIAFGPKGTLIAAGLNDGTARIWKSTGGKEVKIFEGHKSSLLTVAFSADGKLFVSADQDSVHVHQLPSGKELQTFPMGYSGHVAFMPGDKSLAISTVKGVIFWDPLTGREISRREHVAPHVLVTDEKSHVFAASESHKVILWDLATGEPMGEIERHAPGVRSLAWIPGTQSFASGSWDETARVWDLEQGTLRLTLKDQDSVNAVAASPDGSLVASGTTESVITLFKAKSGEKAGALEMKNGWVNALAFEPGGGRLWSGEEGKMVTVMDVPTQRVLQEIPVNDGAVNSIALSPDGKMVAAGTQESSVHLWDTSSYGELASASMGNGVNSLMWSPDGTTLLAAENEGVLFDTRGGNLMKIGELDGHDGWVQAVAYRPDGKMIATGSSDETVRLWDAGTRTLTATLTGHEGMVESVIFQPDGKRLLSAAEDGTVRIWSADGKPLLALRAVEGTSDGYAFTPGPDGRIELFGAAGRAFPICRIGQRSYRFDLCRERFEAPGLMAKVLAGDRSYLDP